MKKVRRIRRDFDKPFEFNAAAYGTCMMCGRYAKRQRKFQSPALKIYSMGHRNRVWFELMAEVRAWRELPVYHKRCEQYEEESKRCVAAV